MTLGNIPLALEYFFPTEVYNILWVERQIPIFFMLLIWSHFTSILLSDILLRKFLSVYLRKEKLNNQPFLLAFVFNIKHM